MIIVSQNKNIAINMEKVLSIYRNKGQIGAEYPFEDAYAHLAKYESEERAEEVFEELMERYENWENMKFGQPNGICKPIYYMPKD